MAKENRRPVKITLFVHRNKEMSEEDFHTYWTNKHPSIVEEWLKKYGVTRYVQYHTPSSYRSQAQEELESFGSFVKDNMLDYDGSVELSMPSAKCWDDARRDPYYEKEVKPDEEKFFDMDRSVIIVGYEEIKFEVTNQNQT